MDTTTATKTNRIRSGMVMEGTLLAAMAVSLVLSVVLEGTATNTDDMAVRSAVQQFDDAYEKARTAAVNSGHPSVIHIDGSRIWVEVDRTDGTGERTRIGRIVDLRYSGVEVATTTRSVCFDSTGTARVRGRCSAAGGRIRFSKGSSVRTVVTTAVGLIPA